MPKTDPLPSAHPASETQTRQAQQTQTPTPPLCDPASGTCTLPETSSNPPEPSGSDPASARPILRYVGDPMCSWCWGIAPTLHAVAAYCARHQIAFSITTGGLRAGGGEIWNASFKAFLRGEWEKIQQRTGQPFGFTLLDQAHFDYDTEPACRAVVTAAHLLHAPTGAQAPAQDHQDQQNHPNQQDQVLAFFAGIQRKFYVDGQDPKQSGFYQELCLAAGLDYAAFCTAFASAAMIEATRQDFARCRQWGVRGFPCLLLEHRGNLHLLASGYIDQPELINRLEARLAL